MTAPGDRGLQPERTELAWRRTLLALAAGSLIALRVLPPVLGGWTLAAGLGGVVAAGVLWSAAHRRTRRIAAGFGRSALPGGLLLALVALFAAMGALLGLLRLLVELRVR